MSRRLFLTGLSAVGLGSIIAIGADVAGAEGAEEKKGGKDAKADPALAQQVDLMPVAVPVLHKGVIVNYVFVRTRIHLFKPSDAPIIKTKEPFIRDALVRSANRTPYNLPDDLNRIDAAALEKYLTQAVEGFVGRGVVKRVEIYEQNPQRGLPRPTS